MTQKHLRQIYTGTVPTPKPRPIEHPAKSSSAEPAVAGQHETGEKGNPAPISPLLVSGAAHSVANGVPSPNTGGIADYVYTAAPKSNPLIAALKLAGLYMGPRDDGGHSVTCHKAAEHLPADPIQATYFEPTTTHPYGRYVCGHDHAEKVRVEDLLDHLSVTRAEARGKPRIRVSPGETYLATLAADGVLAEGPYFRSNGSIVRIIEQDGRASLQRLSDQTLSAVLAASIHWEHKSRGGWDQCDPPSQVVRQLFGQDPSQIRRLEGLAHQPFLRTDGSVVTTPGYDAETGIYGAFNAEDYPFGLPTEDTARRSLEYLDSLIGEFPFASGADKSAARSLLLTASIRPGLPQAPGYNINAPLSGSGKSYLAKVATYFASPDPPYNASYPTTPDEATKLMPAMLSEKPPVILFDDMQFDWLPHGAMNTVLSSPYFTGRVLGESRTVTVRTNSLIMGTGNDIEPARDMRRRVVSIRLEPESETPALHRFVSDPVAVVRNTRARAVTAALEIIRAYRAAGQPKMDVPPINTYEDWSTWCRQPLLWLGLPDPATSLIKQVNQDADRDARKRFLITWYECFESEPMLVKDIIKSAQRDGDLMDALTELPVMTGSRVNAKRLGWYLKIKCRRPVDGLKAEPCDAPQQRVAWRVVRVAGGAVRGGPHPDCPDETGEMGDRRFRRFSDEDDTPPTRPPIRARAG